MEMREPLILLIKLCLKCGPGEFFDQIGFGFHRYSTDREWLVPHFEKMLYDQAMLTLAYSEAFEGTGKVEFKNTIEEILTYVLGSMTSPEGGFNSAEDADSEGEEGKFYFWSYSDLEQFLNPDELEFAKKVFNIGKGNEEKEKIPHLLTADINFTNNSPNRDTFYRQFESIRTKMYFYREQKVHPFKDDKILTDWNGLMIAGLAKAARILNNSSYLEAAENAYLFIENKLRADSEKLFHRFRNEEASIEGNLDDYSFFIFGLLELYASTYKAKYLNRAIELASHLLKYFWDEKEGGFYFTPGYGEELIVRTKEIYDDAIPSGNSIMLNNLTKLYRLTSEEYFYEYASGIVKCFSEYISKSPYASTMLLSAYHLFTGNSIEVIIAGNPEDDLVKKNLDKISSLYLPNLSVVLHDAESEDYNLSFNYLAYYKTD